MNFAQLNGDAVQRLLTRRGDDCDSAIDYAVCSVGDYFRQVEGIKKSKDAHAGIGSIRSRAAMFHKYIDDGTVHMPPLELQTLQSALFEDEGLYYDPRLHADIVRADVSPESTVSMLVFREFDRAFDTSVFDEYRSQMSN